MMRKGAAATSFCLALAAVLVCTLAGCDNKGGAGATAAETAQAFAKALEAGNMQAAAATFDYVTEAREQNENWDDIPGGQRDLIIKKLQEARAAELSQYKNRLGKSIKVGSQQADTITLTGESGQLNLALRELEGKWYIYRAW